jgi:hypothetical protein
VKFDEIRLGTEPAWLVKRLIPRVGLTVLYGPEKTFKSFFTLDLFLHVALGRSYRGRAVHAGPVVYCALEGGEGIAKRVEAFRQNMAEDASDTPFYLVAARVDLVKDHEELIRAIRTNLGERNPVGVVLDTLNRSLAGSESSDADMGAYIKAADAICEAFNCAVLVVHHCGIERSRPRGHTSLSCAAEAQLAVKRVKDDAIEVRVEFMKEGPEGELLLSRLVPVEIGIDSDGDPLKSLVVLPVEQESEPVSAPKGKKLPHGASIAFEALKHAIDNAEVPAPESNYIPPGARVTTIGDWRIHAYARGISASSEDRAKQQAFKRAYEKLVADGYVAVWQEYVWIIRDKA